MALTVPAAFDRCPDWLAAACARGLLSHIPRSLVDVLVDGGHRVEYPNGAVILRWKDSGSTFIVTRGVLREFLADRDGRQLTLRHLQAGDVAGLVPEDRGPVSRGLQVLDRAELLVISQKRIQDMIASEPEFAAAVIEALTSNIATSMASFYVRAFGSVRERVIVEILDRAALTGGIATGKRLSGTQQDLAVAIGSVREVVAAVLQDLKREGLIEVRRGEIVILKPETLSVEVRMFHGWEGAGGAPSSSNIKSSTKQ